MSRWNRFGRKIKRKMIYIFILIAVLCLTFIYAAAKYMSPYRSQSRAIASDAFYFSADLIGDSRMTADEGAGKSSLSNTAENPEGGYQFQPVQEKTWHLYGGTEHNIRMELRNYYDSLRITQDQIAYQAEIQTAGPDNPEESDQDLASLASIGEENQGTVNDVSFLSGVLGAEASQKGESKELTLHIESHEKVKYADGTTVKAVIKSTSPYEKTIELNFVLHFTETDLSYEVKDSVGNPYAELIIKNSIPGGAEDGNKVQPWLIWPKELIIDSTNALTYTCSSGNSSFTQQNIESTDQGSRCKMQVSEPLEVSESRSICFFKENTAQNYTQKLISVEPGADGTYTITIK